MKQIVKRYFVYYLLVLTVMFVSTTRLWGETWQILLFNIYSFIGYVFILYAIANNNLYPVKKKLKMIIFSYSLLSVFILNFLYYFHHGDFFQFQSFDEQTYHYYGLKAAKMPFINAFGYLSASFDRADIGALMYVSMLYRLIEHTIFINFVNVLCGVISSIVLFKMSLNYMPLKYAFAASISFFGSSYMIAMESSGLKEAVFILIVLYAFYYFVLYTHTKRIKALFFAALFGGTILLFRPAVLGMVLVSSAISMALNHYGSSLRNFSVAGVFVILFLFMSSSLEKLDETYSSFNKSVELRVDAVSKAGESVAVYAAVTASFFGPFPNLIARVGKENNSLFSVGLFFRVLLAVPFWFGVWLVIRRRLSQLYPFTLMSLMGLAALLYIMESYELRYHLTHLPFVYIIAFYYLSYLDKITGYKRVRLNKLLDIGYFGLTLLLLFWNLRLV